MNNLFIPAVVWVQITTISAWLVLTEAIHINDSGGYLAIIYSMLALVVFLLPFLWSGRIYCTRVVKTVQSPRSRRRRNRSW